VIVNDHEPVALERQLRRRYGAGLGWEVRERSSDRVAVAIWLAAAPEPGRSAAADGAKAGGPSPTPVVTPRSERSGDGA
jgi:uncharacterized protein (DUF2249 family)